MSTSAASAELKLSSSLLRGLQIYELFLSEDIPWRITDVAAALSIPNSTTHRYLKTLVYRGYLTQSGVAPRYRLVSDRERHVVS